MSFDLVVFEPDNAPRECVAFMEWYRGQAAWSEPLNYDDPANASPRLKRWYDSMRASFPAMNGPDATTDYDNLRVTGYTIGRHLIYADFRWDYADEAYAEALKLAQAQRLGFFDASGSGNVWLPAPDDDYQVLKCGES
jgi:hypothetical protein